MKAFLQWVRNRFALVDLVHLVDVDDETLEVLMFQNGPSRDEFIKILIYKSLLDIDSEAEESQKYKLEKIFVTFGLLDKEVAQQFLNGSMSTKLHIATWKIIIEALLPTLTTLPQWSSYEEMMNTIYEKSNHFRSIVKRNYLPPELIPKLKVQTVLKENTENIEEMADKLIEMLQKSIKSDENADSKTVLSSEEKSNESMDLISIEKEINHYYQISNDNQITSLGSEQSVKMSPQQFIEITEKQDLIHTYDFESKADEIFKLMKAEQDLQILINSLIDQV